MLVCSANAHKRSLAGSNVRKQEFNPHLQCGKYNSSLQISLLPARVCNNRKLELGASGALIWYAGILTLGQTSAPQ